MADDVIRVVNGGWIGRNGFAYVCPNGLKILPSASGLGISANSLLQRTNSHQDGSYYTIPTASSILDNRFDNPAFYSN